jgi:ATP-dependent Lon protease
MLPGRNRKDLEDVPEKARSLVRFVWLERVDDAIEAALNPRDTEHQDTVRNSHTAPTERQAARSL